MLPLYPLGTIIQDHVVAVVIVPFGQEELCGVAKPISLVVLPTQEVEPTSYATLSRGGLWVYPPQV